MTPLLEAQLGQKLIETGQTICTAESCTGGLLGHRLTNVGGSSAYMLGGVIAYSNQAKMHLLTVQEATLVAVGAVSEAVAREMALGAQTLFGADFALSVTGIAGPSGGTPEKPVGLTYIGVAHPDGVQVARYLWSGDREGNKTASAEAAFELVLNLLS